MATSPLIQSMENHPFIRVRPVDGLPGVVSCNFTRDAFIRGEWDDLTVTARGFFFDTVSNRVVARGYDKFFNVGETHGPADLAEVISESHGNLAVRRKYNGYLAIATAHPFNHDEVLFLSKSGVTDYSREAQRIFMASFADREADLARFMRLNDVCLTFECISGKDPHIVNEGHERLVLLDAICLSTTFMVDEQARRHLVDEFGFESPDYIFCDGDPEQFLQWKIDKAEHLLDEGLVIIYGDGRMTKYKTRAYREIKGFRSALRRYMSKGQTQFDWSRPGGSTMKAFLDSGIDPEDYLIDGITSRVVDIPALYKAVVHG